MGEGEAAFVEGGADDGAFAADGGEFLEVGDGGDAAGGDDGAADGGDELMVGLEVGLGEGAVAGDVGEHDAGDAGGVELLGEVDGADVATL